MKSAKDKTPRYRIETYRDKYKTLSQGIMIDITMVRDYNKEIERLNNNWNELEKFICDLEIECNIDNSMWGVAVIIHNKLKELKGVDKE